MSQHEHCKYHQQTPARWYCPNCHINFCTTCVNDFETQDPPDCAICDSSLDDNGLEAFIPPFWHRIPLFFKIVWSKPVAILILILMVSAFLLPNIPIVGQLFTYFILPLVFLRYAYLLLEEIASGELNAPDLRQIAENDDYMVIFKQIFILALMIAPLNHIANISYGLMVLYYMLALFLIPATVMVLSVDGNLLRAVNPIFLLAFIKRIGFSYLGLYILLMTISGGPSIIIDIIYNALYADDYYDQGDWQFLMAVFLVLQMYFTLVIFAIMGYVLLRFHQRLGYQIDANPDNFIGGFKQPPRVNPLLKDVEVLIREKNLAKALSVLRKRLMDNLQDITVRIRYHKLLLANQETERLTNHGDDVLALLLSSQNPVEAITVYQDCKNADKDFNPSNVDHYLPLAELMMRLGHYKWVVLLLKGVHLRFPDYKNIPQLYFLLAKALSDGLKQEQKAKQVLEFTLNKYPAAGNLNEITNYLNVLNRALAAVN